MIHIIYSNLLLLTYNMSIVYKPSEPIDTIIVRKLHVNETAMFHKQSEIDNEPTKDNHIANKKYIDQVVSYPNGSDTILINANNVEVNSSGISNQILLSSGTPGTASTFGALPLSNANSVTGILNVARGGTGASTFTSDITPNIILKGNETSAITSSSVWIDSIYGINGITNFYGTLIGKFAQAPSVNDGIQIPNGTFSFYINAGEATTDFQLLPPILPSVAGQILYVYNESPYNTTAPLVVNSLSGDVFAYDGNTWRRLYP